MVAVMPAYVVGREGRGIDERGDLERKNRAMWMDEIWKYYDGASRDMLVVEAGKYNDNIKNNLTQRAVDRAVEFIGVPMDFEILGLGKEDDAQRELDSMYEKHRSMFSEIVQSGLISGHVFIKLIVNEDDVTFAPIDPRLVTVYTNAMNPREVVFYRIQWNMEDEGYRQDFVPKKYVQDDAPSEATWAVIDYRLVRGQWERVAFDWWFMDFAPIVEWRNKKRAWEYYGASDYGFAPKANDAINFLESNTGRILKFHAHPRTIGAGVQVDDIQMTSIDGFFTVPDEAQIYNLEMQSDLSSSMNFLTMKKADFFDACRVVDPSSIKDKVGSLTNFGLRVIYSNMLEMTDEKRGEYGAGLSEVFRRMLVMVGYELEAGEVVARWSDPLPVNRLELLQTATIEKGLGITSDKTIAETIERDYENEQAMKADEMTTAGEALAGVLARAGETGGM